MQAWCTHRQLLSHCLPAQQLSCLEHRRWMNYYRKVSSSALTSFRSSVRLRLLVTAWQRVSLTPRTLLPLFLCLQMYANEWRGSGSVQPLHAHSNSFPSDTSAVTVVVLLRLRVASLSPLLWLEQLPLGVTGNGNCFMLMCQRVHTVCVFTLALRGPINTLETKNLGTLWALMWEYALMHILYADTWRPKIESVDVVCVCVSMFVFPG